MPIIAMPTGVRLENALDPVEANGTTRAMEPANFHRVFSFNSMTDIAFQISRALVRYHTRPLAIKFTADLYRLAASY